jgi:hypothetical protein
MLPASELRLPLKKEELSEQLQEEAVLAVVSPDPPQPSDDSCPC